MGVGMSTIVQWTVIVAVAGAYFLYSRKTAPLPVAQKASGARGKDGLLEETSSAGKGKKAVKKGGKQQNAASTSNDLQVPTLKLGSGDNDDETPTAASLEEDKGSLQRLASFKSGQTKVTKPEPKADKKKADKQTSKAAPAAAAAGKLTPVPVSPMLGAISSTSSTTGADGDIDEPDSVDEENPVDDMLEKTVGPSVMRITPGQDEFTTVTRKKGGQQSEKKEGLTSLQKKNQKKNEMKKELKKQDKEDQLKRLEAHKREQRLAREAEAAKHPKKNQAAAPSSSAWSGSNTPLAGSNGQNAVPAAGLLDTFDSSASANSRSGITPSSSDFDSGFPLSDAIPEEFLAEHHAAQRELPLENEWVEVKSRQKNKKKPAQESETDSDAYQNLTASASSAARAGLSAATTPSANQPVSQAKPKKTFTEEDLKIPGMPPNKNSDGWDAHVW
ncbi:hypothetical protein Dda_9336 [Drechslerella dactyloides]|uniref:Uncharacterized protein n=1 Tax=Drechslerella dactyloides TaxID=74499 RepID=A0AAD6NF84_DREDA|nr:hypothetical protein Dda_9336 [Drechslerella dactyloides]